MNTVDFDKETSSFIVSNNETITIPYKHEVFSYLDVYDLNDFDFFFLKNPYFKKEKDIFEVYLDESEKRDGYLFHFDLLTSEEEWNEHSNLNDYLYTTIKRYFSQIVNELNEKVIEDFFGNHNDLFILVINHHNTKIKTDINLYLLDLLSFGFVHEKNCIRVDGFDSDDYLLEKRIKLSQRKPNWISESFISNIILNMLPMAQTPEMSFYLSYQVIEFFMRNDKEKEWNELLDNISKATVTDYKDIGEQIHEINKEKPRIEEIFNQTTFNPNIKDQFKKLYKESGLFTSEQKHFYEQFYSFRNMFTHNYEALMKKEDEMCRLCFFGKQIVFEILKSRYSIEKN